jgi:hypothetical protein
LKLPPPPLAVLLVNYISKSSHDVTVHIIQPDVLMVFFPSRFGNDWPAKDGFFGNHFKFFIANDACPVDLCYTDQSP